MAASGYDVSITITTRWREAGKPPSPEPVQKTEQAVRRTTAALKEQQGVLSRFIQNWKSTFAVFALGYVSVVSFLEVLRAVTSEFTLGFRAIEEYRQAVISLSAVTMMFMKTSGELSEDWKRATDYATALTQKAEELDRIYTGTAQELLAAARALMTMGVAIDLSNRRQLESWVALAEAAKAVTTAENKEFQIRQEIQALLEGQTRQGATLARILDRQLKTVEGIPGGLKEALQIWKAQGIELEEIAKRLQGFKQAQTDIQELVSTQYATLSTINRRILRQGFIPAYQALNDLLKKAVDYFTDAEEGLRRQANLADRIALTWITIIAALKTIKFYFTALKDIVYDFWKYDEEHEGVLSNLLANLKAFYGGLAILAMKAMGATEEEITQMVARMEGIGEAARNQAQKTSNAYIQAAKEMGTEAFDFWKNLFNNILQAEIARYRASLNQYKTHQLKRIEVHAQADDEILKKELESIRKLDEAWKSLMLDYERYQTQIATITEDLATERLRIEAKLTGDLESQYRYRMQQIEKWEAEKWNRVISLQDSMLKKLANLRNKIEEQAAKESRELRLDEIATLVDIEIKEMEVYKNAQEQKVKIAEIAAERIKEIYLDIYGYAINLGDILEQSVADAFEGIILGTRKLEDVFIAMRDAIVGHFAQMIAKMIRQKLDFDTVWITNVENMPEQFGKSVFNIRNIWNSLMNWMTSSIGKLTGALGTIGYGIAGAVRGEPWRAMGGTVATVAMLTGHPVIAVATIATAEIARAIFKGRVEWVSVGAPAAGMAATRIGLEKTWWGVGLGMGWLESVSEFLFGWMGGLFRRKWPTIRGTAEISLKGLSDSLDYVEQYMEEIEKYLDEHTEIYAMYKTRFTRITIIEKRDVKGSMDKLAEAFGSFVDDLIDFYKSILPETMRFEELPDIRFTFGAGEKNMEKLAKQFVNELVSQTYNAWAIPIIEEYNKLLGINLFEKFGLPELGELPIEIGHDWNKEMKKLYRRITREVLPSLEAALKYAKTMMNLMDRYGEEVINIYKEAVADKIVNMLDRYKAEVEGLEEEEVKKKAEELGKTIDEYLSAVVSFIEEIEDTIAKYTLPEGAREIRELEQWYQEMLARAEALGLSIERLNEAMALKFFAPFEELLDTRTDYEKALADLEAWGRAAIQFFEKHREVLEELGYSEEMILKALAEKFMGPIEEMVDTRSDLEKALDDLTRWYVAAMQFFNKYKDILEALGYSIDTIIEAFKQQLKKLIESRILEPLRELWERGLEWYLGSEAYVSYRISQLEAKWAPLWNDIDALASRWDELIADARDYLSLLIQQYEAEVAAIRAAAEAEKERIRAAAEAQKEALRAAAEARKEALQREIDAIRDQISLLEEQRREIESLKEEWEGVIDSIKERLQELQFGPEAPVLSWEAFQRRWAELVEAAKTSPEAAQQLIEFSRQYLEMARIYAPSQYLQIWQQVVSTLQDVQENAVSEIDLLQSQIDAIDVQTEMLEQRIEAIQNQISQIDENLSRQLAAIDASVSRQLEAIDRHAEEQIALLKEQYAQRMLMVYNRLKEVGEYLAKQVEEQMPEDIRLLTDISSWLEKIYKYLETGVPSAQTGGITTREGLYRLHPGEVILPPTTSIKVEIDSDKLGRSIASSLVRAGIVSEKATSIHLHIDGREIASIMAEQIRRGHPELIKQVRRLTH